MCSSHDKPHESYIEYEMRMSYTVHMKDHYRVHIKPYKCAFHMEYVYIRQIHKKERTVQEMFFYRSQLSHSPFFSFLILITLRSYYYWFLSFSIPIILHSHDSQSSPLHSSHSPSFLSSSSPHSPAWAAPRQMPRLLRRPWLVSRASTLRWEQCIFNLPARRYEGKIVMVGMKNHYVFLLFPAILEN